MFGRIIHPKSSPQDPKELAAIGLFKDQQFGAAHGTCHPSRETSRCQHVATPKSDLRWYRDLAQSRRDIMRDHCIRFLEKSRQRLHWPTAHEFGQGLDVLWL